MDVDKTGVVISMWEGRKEEYLSRGKQVNTEHVQN